MANQTLYNTKSLNDVRNRTTTPLTSEESIRVNTIVNKFFELFKAEHLG